MFNREDLYQFSLTLDPSKGREYNEKLCKEYLDSKRAMGAKITRTTLSFKQKSNPIVVWATVLKTCLDDNCYLTADTSSQDESVNPEDRYYIDLSEKQRQSFFGSGRAPIEIEGKEYASVKIPVAWISLHSENNCRMVDQFILNGTSAKELRDLMGIGALMNQPGSGTLYRALSVDKRIAFNTEFFGEDNGITGKLGLAPPDLSNPQRLESEKITEVEGSSSSSRVTVKEPPKPTPLPTTPKQEVKNEKYKEPDCVGRYNRGMRKFFAPPKSEPITCLSELNRMEPGEIESRRWNHMARLNQEGIKTIRDSSRCPKRTLQLARKSGFWSQIYRLSNKDQLRQEAEEHDCEKERCVQKCRWFNKKKEIEFIKGAYMTESEQRSMFSAMTKEYYDKMAKAE